MGSSPAPEIKVKITGEDTGVSAAIRELGVQLQQLKKTQDDAGSSARNLGEAEAGAGRSMREAREGARLLSEETGVRLNRGLVSVISRSATLGPLLNAAFPIAAAIGFGEVIVKGTEKLTALIANTFIYTEAMQEQYAAQLKANQGTEKANEKIKELKKAYELIGLTGSARGSVLAKRAKEEVDEAIKELDRLKKKEIEVAQPGWAKQLMGGLLDQAGIHTGLGFSSDEDRVGAQGTKDAQITEQRTTRDALIDAQRTADKELADQKDAEAKTAAEKAKTLQDSINRARLAQIEAGFANELELFKAQHEKLDQDNEASYVGGLESTAQYYAKKQQLAAEASQKEIDALTAERARVLAAPSKDKAGEIEQQTKAADLANKIAIAKVNGEKVQQQLANEGAQKQEELDRKKLEFEAQIAKAQGQRFDEAAERISAQAIEMGQKLREQGMAPDQVAAMVGKFKAASTQQAQFAGMKAGGQDAIANFSDQEEDIRLKNIAIVAEAKIAELERTRIPVLQTLATQMKAAAITPEETKDADDYAKAVDKIAVAAKKSTVSMQGFEDSASQAIKGDLTTFLGSTIDKAKSVGDAFQQLAGAAVASIQKIVAQLIIQIAFQKLAQEAEAGGGGVGGLFSSLHLAGGGLVSGPGSGTSDSVPARLSTGEFVMRAAAVQDWGVDRLAAMNRGLHVPSIRGKSIPRFAEGGLVQGAGGRGGAMDLKLGLGLDQGLVLKHLESKAAGKVILQHIANNPKAAGKALQRGGH
jgi:hypothetical protein